MEIYRKKIVDKATEILSENNIVDAPVDAFLLAEYVFGFDRNSYYLYPNNEEDSEKEELYFSLIEKRCSGVPLQHITGKQEFMGFQFDVSEDVLIPRQDTEELVERVVSYIGNKSVKVLDMCTGSGCIAISIDKLCDGAKVDAVDISDKALAIAKINNEKNNANVSFIKSDVFLNVEDKYDIIVSNPPYIATHVIESLMTEVKDHEPFIALDGKEDGLYFYDIITREARNYLNDGGMIFYEIGYDQGVSVSNLLKEAGYSQIKVIKDLAGNDRVVVARKE